MLWPIRYQCVVVWISSGLGPAYKQLTLRTVNYDLNRAFRKVTTAQVASKAGNMKIRIVIQFLKKKGLKVACGAFAALQPVGRLYPCPNEFPSFISRGATHHIGTTDLC